MTSYHPNNNIYWKLDLTKPISHSFTYDVGGHGWGNQELQTYTDSPQNAYITAQGDELVISANVEKDEQNPNNVSYTSARLVSKQCLDLDRGYVEAHIRAPQSQAIWFAFWLLPKKPFTWPGDGEIDICEGWDGKHENGNCVHWGHFNGEDYDKHRVRYHPISKDQHVTGHTYGFCWSEKGLIWFFDGKPTMRAKVPKGIRPFSQFQIMLNIAIGGNVMQNAKPQAPSTHQMYVRDLKICHSPPMGCSFFDEAWKQACDGNTM